jgi:hypothetical protein
MQDYFGSNKYKTFQRNLNLWGYQVSESKEILHEHFIRGQPELCEQMQRIKIKGAYIRGSRSKKAIQQDSNNTRGKDALIASLPIFAATEAAVLQQQQRLQNLILQSYSQNNAPAAAIQDHSYLLGLMTPQGMGNRRQVAADPWFHRQHPDHQGGDNSNNLPAANDLLDAVLPLLKQGMGQRPNIPPAFRTEISPLLNAIDVARCEVSPSMQTLFSSSPLSESDRSALIFQHLLRSGTSSWAGNINDVLPSLQVPKTTRPRSPFMGGQELNTNALLNMFLRSGR